MCSYAQPLNKEIIIQEETCGLKWENNIGLNFLRCDEKAIA